MNSSRQENKLYVLNKVRLKYGHFNIFTEITKKKKTT